jgi:hypothetical protein
MESDNKKFELTTQPNNYNFEKQVEVEKSYNSGGKKPHTGFKKNNQKNYLRSQYSYYNKDGKQ